MHLRGGGGGCSAAGHVQMLTWKLPALHATPGPDMCRLWSFFSMGPSLLNLLSVDGGPKRSCLLEIMGFVRGKGRI